MHQRLDAVNKRRANAPTPSSLKMKADTRFHKKNAPPPVKSPEPEGSKAPAPAGAKSSA